MRKRKLYLSELLNKYIPKAWQNLVIFDESINKEIYYGNSNTYFHKLDIPNEILDRQVKAWEVLHDTDIYIYI